MRMSGGLLTGTQMWPSTLQGASGPGPGFRWAYLLSTAVSHASPSLVAKSNSAGIFTVL